MFFLSRVVVSTAGIEGEGLGERAMPAQAGIWSEAADDTGESDAEAMTALLRARRRGAALRGMAVDVEVGGSSDRGGKGQRQREM
jgi:hypothetical protein